VATATATATVTAADLRIVLTGPEFEPTGPAWNRASEAERRAYWKRLAEIAYFIKRQEIARGVGADGKKLPPVQPSSRPDGAKGQPLDPHYGESRTARLLAYSSTAMGATLYWRASGRKSWAVILGYHARVGGEVRGAPLRDTLGISPRGRKQVAAQARQWWTSGRPRPAPAPVLRPRPRPAVIAPPPPPKPTLPPQAARVPKFADRAQARAWAEAHLATTVTGFETADPAVYQGVVEAIAEAEARIGRPLPVSAVRMARIDDNPDATGLFRWDSREITIKHQYLVPLERLEDAADARYRERTGGDTPFSAARGIRGNFWHELGHAFDAEARDRGEATGEPFGGYKAQYSFRVRYSPDDETDRRKTAEMEKVSGYAMSDWWGTFAGREAWAESFAATATASLQARHVPEWVRELVREILPDVR
jgi:hypothetical protein